MKRLWVVLFVCASAVVFYVAKNNISISISRKPDTFEGVRRATAGLKAVLVAGGTLQDFSSRVQEFVLEVSLVKQDGRDDSADFESYDSALSLCQDMQTLWAKIDRAEGTGLDLEVSHSMQHLELEDKARRLTNILERIQQYDGARGRH